MPVLMVNLLHASDTPLMHLQGVDKPCAQWALVRPGAVPELLKQLHELFGGAWAHGLANGQLLTAKQVDEVALHMSSADFVVLRQKAGDMVTVPCGWPHQVVNLQSCVKVTCDVCNPDNLLHCLASWKLVQSGIMATGAKERRNTLDGVCAAAAVVKAILALISV